MLMKFFWELYDIIQENEKGRPDRHIIHGQIVKETKIKAFVHSANVSDVSLWALPKRYKTLISLSATLRESATPTFYHYNP